MPGYITLSPEKLHEVLRTVNRAGLNGEVCESAQWVPPQYATDDPDGVFVLRYANNMLSGSSSV